MMGMRRPVGAATNGEAASRGASGYPPDPEAPQLLDCWPRILTPRRNSGGSHRIIELPTPDTRLLDVEEHLGCLDVDAPAESSGNGMSGHSIALHYSATVHLTN